MYSVAKIDKLAKVCPENLIFCNDKFLIEIAKDDFNEEVVRANCLAELLLREYFSRDKKLRQELSIFLTEKEISGFLGSMPHNFFTSGDEEHIKLSGSNSLSISCFAALRKRLKWLFMTDGLIPVERGNHGWLIPFDLQIGTGEFGVFDLEGISIPEWSDAVKLLNCPLQIKIRLHCHYQSDAMGNLIGHSLMLPVWVAYLGKTAQLPKYNPFRLIFTGAMNSDGILTSVETIGKIRAIVRAYPQATFFLPEDGAGNAEMQNLFFLPLVGKQALFRNIQHAIEKNEDVLLEYAQKRLPSICDEVRFLQHSNWDELILRLEHNAAFDEDGNPEEYLLNLILQSEANRHAGHTEQALKLNLKAQAVAQSHGKRFEKMLMRLQVNKLVLLLDNEKFDEISSLVPSLNEMIDNSGDVDLQMRFHGTMGQIQAYGTLAHVVGCTKEQSWRHFCTAKDKAFELGSLQEKRQDLNYLHLWHAIFMPGTPEELLALKRAEKMAAPRDNETEISDNRIRNICYLRRQQLLAWYRYWLLTGNIIEHKLPGDIDQLLNGANTWCRALAYKYLGALAAGSKNIREAEEFFACALEPVQEESSPIIRFIKMTIYAEAYRSLCKQKYRHYGNEIALILQKEYPNPLVVTPWMEYFEGKRETAPFLNYWY